MSFPSPERTADSLAGASVMLFAGLTLSQWNEIAQICAGFGAFIAGLSAAYYHLFKAPTEENKRGK